MILYSGGRQSDIQMVNGRLVDVYVDERLRKCVFFMFADLPNGNGRIARQVIGSGFFVSKSLYESDKEEDAKGYPRFMIYAVTARHVIADYKDYNLYIRFNTKDSFFDLPTKAEDWIDHPEPETTDVCIYDLASSKSPEGEKPEMICIPFHMLASAKYMSETPIVEGFDVFIISLFKGYSGKKQSQPVTRYGNIALMPREKVDVYLTEEDRQAYKKSEIDAYLIDIKTLEGMSGAPTLFYYPPLEESTAPVIAYNQLPKILGLVQGLYEEDLVNSKGDIAIVIPAEKIREAILQNSQVEARQKELIEKKNRAFINNPMKPKPAS